MFGTVVSLFRPTRTFDGEGGIVSNWGTAIFIWTDPIVQEDGEMTLAVHTDEDVRIGDLISVKHNLFQ